NTFYIAAAQGCTGAGLGGLPSLGALMVVQMLGSPELSGLAIGMLGVSRFVVSYPIGVLADRHGRKAAMTVSLVVAVMGAILSGIAMLIGGFVLFMAGVFIFGLAVGGTQQLRVAATDMYPPQRRGEGLGYVVTGAVGGSIGVVILVAVAQKISDVTEVNALALSWLLTPVMLIPALLLVTRIRPDPKEIAANLEHYYPGYHPPAPRDMPGAETGNALAYLTHFPKLTAFVSNFAVQGNMSMIMVAAVLVLQHHGHSLPAIAVSTSIHSIGMFGFAVPQGWLADRIGRRAVMLAGLVIAGLGSPLLVVTGDYTILTAGFFMVGFGWSCVSVASSALLADVTHPGERGRVLGVSDTFTGGANVVLALTAGPMMGAMGLEAVGAVGIGLMVVPVVMLLRVRERPFDRV
ncbi:MAG: MFS transporter, partial [Chloroflexota bacterium]